MLSGIVLWQGDGHALKSIRPPYNRHSYFGVDHEIWIAWFLVAPKRPSRSITFRDRGENVDPGSCNGDFTVIDATGR